MSEQGKIRIEAFAAGLIGFFVVAGVGTYLVLQHQAPAPTSATVAFQAMSASASAARSASASPEASAGSGASPAPLLSAEFREAQGAPAAPSALSQPASGSPRGLATLPHLEASAGGATAASGAAAAAGPDAAKAPSSKPAGAAKPGAARKTDAVAATVHYGASTRSELMGRAAGPVYNFGAERAPAPPDTLTGVVQQVDDAVRQADASGVGSADKAAFHEEAEQMHKAVFAAEKADPSASVPATAPSAP